MAAAIRLRRHVQIVAVANVAPTVTAPSEQSSNEGTSHTFDLGTFSDPGTDSPWQRLGRLGRQFADRPTTQITGSGSASNLDIGPKSHTYADGPGDHTVSVTVTDENGGSRTRKTFSVHVNNVAPTVTSPGDQSASEGSSHSFSLGSFSDPGPDSPCTASVDWGDRLHRPRRGSGQSLGSLNHTYADNGNYTVTVTVTDKDGGVGATSFTATVANVAPTATFSNDGPVNEGSSFHLSLTNPSDPSTADTTAGFTYAFDCGDGSGYGAFSAAASATCPTNDNGIRTRQGQDHGQGRRRHRVHRTRSPSTTSPRPRSSTPPPGG